MIRIWTQLPTFMKSSALYLTEKFNPSQRFRELSKQTKSANFESFYDIYEQI